MRVGQWGRYEKWRWMEQRENIGVVQGDVGGGGDYGNTKQDNRSAASLLPKVSEIMQNADGSEINPNLI